MEFQSVLRFGPIWTCNPFKLELGTKLIWKSNQLENLDLFIGQTNQIDSNPYAKVRDQLDHPKRFIACFPGTIWTTRSSATLISAGLWITRFNSKFGREKHHAKLIWYTKQFWNLGLQSNCIKNIIDLAINVSRERNSQQWEVKWNMKRERVKGQS